MRCRAKSAGRGLARYVIGTKWERIFLEKLLRMSALLLIAGLALYCLADFSLNQRQLTDLSPRFFAKHYACQAVKRLPKLLPLCGAICTLRALWQMRRSGEWIALETAGISIARISAPLVRYGLISCLLGGLAFEALYPKVAANLRYYEQRPPQSPANPRILYPSSKQEGSSTCLVYLHYQPSAQINSSGVFQRGFFRPNDSLWIYFDSLQFFEKFARIKNAIQLDLSSRELSPRRERTLLIPHRVDLTSLSRQTVPAEDQNLAQLSQAAKLIPGNALAGAYYHYRVQQVLMPLFAVYMALALFLSSLNRFSALSLAAAFVLLAILEGLDQVGLILSSYHLLGPFWLWVPFTALCGIWLKSIYFRQFRPG